LGELLAIKGATSQPYDATVVVLETSRRRLGLVVDEVVSRQQVVIKSIESTMGDSGGIISGAAILPDGRVGLILDVDALYSSEGSMHVTSAHRSSAGPIPQSEAARPREQA
jgi:two-component system chemotaxis sensor kinase CheA